MYGLIIVGIIAIAVAISYLKRRAKIASYELPANARQLLTDNVSFYASLDEANKRVFEARVKDFLAHVSVRGVDVEVDDLDRLLVASGAIILIFAFPDWRYNNLNEVLLYKGTFTKEFDTDAKERNVLGMVGDGAMHRNMVLSKPSLLASFKNDHDGHNTVMHEFAHLLDKADGVVDGIPEYLLIHPHLAPWVALMHKTIAQMKAQRSDIDFYAATNDAEFFAVVVEYFFEQPDKLKDHHPELFAMMEEMFHPVKTA